jgi:predicted AAA+ superfamily ATPase
LNKDILKQLIIEGHELIKCSDVMRRDIPFEKNGNYVLIGIRRAGKTSLMFQVIKDQIADGLAVEHILYINFEDERLLEFKAEDFNLLIEAHGELFGVKPVFFLDEIHTIKGWEKFVRRLADNKQRVYVTGSNATMLSREIASTLGARFLTQEVQPFTFNEYLKFQGIELIKNWEYSDARFEVRRAFDAYLQFGGFPELLQFSDKKHWLDSLYQKILYGDIVARFDVRNDYAMKLLVKKLAESVTDRISYNRATNLIKSVGVKIGVSTVVEYISHLREAFLIFEVDNILAKLSERESSKKYYFMDHGLLGLFSSKPTSQQLENIVALTLRKNGHEYYFARDAAEIDFVIPQTSTAIQVCHSLQDKNVRERELSAFKKLRDKVSADNNLIITMDETETIKQGDQTIEVVSIWKWLTM